MTLNAAERRRTSEELKHGLALSGLTPQQAAQELDFTPERLQAALDVEPGAGPVDVWHLRDHLELAVRDAGREPVAHTVLTGGARRLALAWFPLREAVRPPSTRL
ncbi:hypothetical protein KNE206_52260 [Kitasatospora sp. NE20-6]|uniref:DUF2316 family protein n=1 Tax=Kitasatospora sp. NE20-6 TaxID=2859066 RepID=UPI0034DBC804